MKLRGWSRFPGFPVMRKLGDFSMVGRVDCGVAVARATMLASWKDSRMTAEDTTRTGTSEYWKIRWANR